MAGHGLKPIAIPAPKGTARELPNGRGFLRVVQGREHRSECSRRLHMDMHDRANSLEASARCGSREGRYRADVLHIMIP